MRHISNASPTAAINLPMNENLKTRIPETGVTADVKHLVLVAEDHDDTRFLLRFWMEMRGCTVVEARNGEEAVRLAETMDLDLVLMDTNLPLVDGLMATRQIRKSPTVGNVPIVFLSGRAEPDARKAALASGGSEYLVKPFEPAELENALERHLGTALLRKADDLRPRKSRKRNQ